jgi:hypothetical protein
MKCKTCGKNSDSDYCFQHKTRKPLPSGRGLTSKKMINSNNKAPQSNNDGYKLQIDMFLSIWKKRPHKSEVSGKYLGQEALSTYFHHILPKSKYPEACLDEENIILLTLEEHSNVEADIYRYEEINKRRDSLKRKYRII